jgi:hypothetical protein
MASVYIKLEVEPDTAKAFEGLDPSAQRLVAKVVESIVLDDRSAGWQRFWSAQDRLANTAEANGLTEEKINWLAAKRL